LEVVKLRELSVVAVVEGDFKGREQLICCTVLVMIKFAAH
jgi:hypothetical protein